MNLCEIVIRLAIVGSFSTMVYDLSGPIAAISAAMFILWLAGGKGPVE